MKEVRVRFAPSPTGGLHIGGIRTALYNYLLARKNRGTMILRIEDTDQGRFVPGAEMYIMECLAWAGIKIDEGIREGGPHSPYRQSERKAIYQQHASQLIQQGHAYYAFDTEDDLEKMRERLKSRGEQNLHYNRISRMEMKNSLSLSANDAQQMIRDGVPHVIRLKVDAENEIQLNDLIRGSVIFQAAQVDDKVLMKSDGMPTYHLAHVVDDHLMKISHVIRGEEWLPSAPAHVLIYRYLGWEKEMPEFAHLPLLLKPDGNGKLSKRDADKMGFPIFPLNWTDPATGETATGYREAGYLPEALINFLALLGWNPGTEQEIFSMDQLIEAFSLERIGKAGSKFDIHKAQWFNQHYLRSRSDSELGSYLIESATHNGFNCPKDKAEKISRALRERITFPQDLWEQGKFFFQGPEAFDEKIVSKKWNDEAAKVLSAYGDALKSVKELTSAEALKCLEETTANHGIKPGQILQLMRMVITGGSSGPDLMQTLEILGGEESSKRITFAVKTIQSKVV